MMKNTFALVASFALLGACTVGKQPAVGIDTDTDEMEPTVDWEVLAWGDLTPPDPSDRNLGAGGDEDRWS